MSCANRAGKPSIHIGLVFEREKCHIGNLVATNDQVTGGKSLEELRAPSREAPRAGQSKRYLGMSARVSGTTEHAIGAILAAAARPDVISFAGGFPAEELFPSAELAAAHAVVFERDGARALQYDAIAGHAPLREWLTTRLAQRGTLATVEDILVTSGTQPSEATMTACSSASSNASCESGA